MNLVILQGRPTRDPTMEKSERTGKVYCKFRLAVDRPYRGKDVPQVGDYFNVVCFDNKAKFVFNHLAKGALCTIQGRLETSEWTDQIGNKREGVTIMMKEITIHEWLRKHKPLHDLDSDLDFDLLVPREITDSLFKQIEIGDEDIPEELLGEIKHDPF